MIFHVQQQITWYIKGIEIAIIVLMYMSGLFTGKITATSFNLQTKFNETTQKLFLYQRFENS